MCGIAGALSLDGSPLDAAALQPMADAMAHRGPDDAGFFCSSPHTSLRLTQRRFQSLHPALPAIDSDAGRHAIAAVPWRLMFAHRRLSILDLSAAGHQPMTDPSGQLVVVFNGEIYNYPELRGQLESAGHRFTSRCDTEVLLHGYRAWGIDFIRRLNGMFAFALLDSPRGCLHLVRDRYGVKPLYLAVDARRLVFASEVKAMLPMLGAAPRVDVQALNEYFSFQNVLSNRTLFAGVQMLEPGCRVSIPLAGRAIERVRWWDYPAGHERAVSAEQAERDVADLIRQAVRRQCLSDVEIGCYLSGGMDSASIASLTAQQFGSLNTFTIGFDMAHATEHERKFDERDAARHIATAIGSRHYERAIGAEALESTLDRLVHHLEDPRVGQCYPNWAAAALAAGHVNVVMAGAGGDELFGGYPWRYAAAVGATPEVFAGNYYRYWQRLVSDDRKAALFQPHVLAALGNPAEQTLASFNQQLGDTSNAHSVEEQVRLALRLECRTFLHGLLVVEDKLSMAHGLESRVPLLDDDLVAYACTLPVCLKLADLAELDPALPDLPGRKKRFASRLDVGKVVLRRAMRHLLPPQVTAARKQGFSGPDETWLRRSLEPWLRSRLLDRNSPITDYLQPAFVRSAIDEHGRGDTNHRLLLWSLLTFDAWLRRFH